MRVGCTYERTCIENFYLDRDGDGICVSASTLVEGSSNVIFSRYHCGSIIR